MLYKILLLTTSLRAVNITSLTRCASLDIYSRPICCCCYYLFGCVFNKLLMYHHHHRRQCRFLCIRFIISKYCNKRAIVMFEINAYWLIDWFSSLMLTNITITLFHRNTEQWQVRLKSLLFGVRISNSPLLPSNSCFNIIQSLNVLQQILFYVHLDHWYWI